MEVLRLLIAGGRTDGLADQTTRLCSLGLISAADRDIVHTEIKDKQAGQ